ncbi:hypothetical protein OAM67_01180 [bacterium]|nr:hypothetical protein [bacterium]
MFGCSRGEREYVCATPRATPHAQQYLQTATQPSSEEQKNKCMCGVRARGVRARGVVVGATVCVVVGVVVVGVVGAVVEAVVEAVVGAVVGAVVANSTRHNSDDDHRFFLQAQQPTTICFFYKAQQPTTIWLLTRHNNQQPFVFLQWNKNFAHLITLQTI